MKQHTPIFLIGYMASGKTTFGRALARETNRDFIDLDFYIEQRFRKSVKEIFADSGEDEFRRIEREMLREAGEFDNVVVACGGGTPCFFDNIDYMNSRGLTICLEAGLDRTIERVMRKPGKRPLLAGLNEAELRATIAAGMEARAPFYNKAAIHLCGEMLENKEQIHNTVMNFLNTHPLFHNEAELPGL